MEVRQTSEFAHWLRNLRDRDAKGRIAVRLRRLSLGNFGDAKSLGRGLWELRIPHGPGYRVYFVRRGEKVVVLLCGGNKSRQAADIDRARLLAKDVASD